MFGEIEAKDVIAINRALSIANDYGSIDGAHHKQWVIDQMVQALTGSDYNDWVCCHNAGSDGPNTYSWDQGIAP